MIIFLGHIQTRNVKRSEDFQSPILQQEDKSLFEKSSLFIWIAEIQNITLEDVSYLSFHKH